MKQPSSALTTLFQYPFRIFFLSVGFWGLLVIAIWLAVLMQLLPSAFAVPPMIWHQHEMVFGLLQAAIAGFLLTAVCVWTGTERLHGVWLLLLWLVWLAGRLSLTFGASLPAAVPITINLLFMPLLILDATRRIVPARQWRHLTVLVALLLLWLAQAALLLSAGSLQAFAIGLVAACALMMIIGGRITPAFSANWLRAHGGQPEAIRNPPWLERLGLLLMLGLCLALLSGEPWAISLLALLSAAATLLRIVLWRGWLTRTEPLLWILHLSLLWIPLGLLLLALTDLAGWPNTVWIHAIGAGAMGGLILGVMTRVALGHTGRPLTLPRGIVSAYWLIHAGAVLRILTALTVLPWREGLVLAGVCWSLALLLFVLRYSSILSQPRVDGKPG